MVTFLVLSDLVILVVGILQIILFFKIWGMTNDVRALKKKFTLSPASLSTSEILKESYKGNPELPNFLFDAVYKDMEAVWNDRLLRGRHSGNLSGRRGRNADRLKLKGSLWLLQTGER